MLGNRRYCEGVERLRRTWTAMWARTVAAGLVALTIASPAFGRGSARVAALQTGLARKGLYRGTVDGVLGPDTRSAVRRLQRRADEGGAAQLPSLGRPEGRRASRALDARRAPAAPGPVPDRTQVAASRRRRKSFRPPRRPLSRGRRPVRSRGGPDRRVRVRASHVRRLERRVRTARHDRARPRSGDDVRAPVPNRDPGRGTRLGRRGGRPRRPYRARDRAASPLRGPPSRRLGRPAAGAPLADGSLRERRQHLTAVALELRRPDSTDAGELSGRRGTARGDLRQRAVVEDDKGGDAVDAGARQPPRLQRPVGRRELGLVPLRRPLRARLDPELGEKRARPPGASHEQMPLRPRHPNIEEPPLLCNLLVRSRLADGQLGSLEPRQEDGLELESLRTVV